MSRNSLLAIGVSWLVFLNNSFLFRLFFLIANVYFHLQRSRLYLLLLVVSLLGQALHID